MKRHPSCMLLLLMALAGCASTSQQQPQSVVFVSRCHEANAGMTFEQISGLLGPPSQKVTEYVANGSIFQAYKYAMNNMVSYQDGKAIFVTCR